MRLAALVVGALTLATLAGCSTPKDYYALGGSRADGTIDLAYDFRQFETPIVRKAQADSLARQKCGVWGYSSAEPFGGQTTQCHHRDGFGTCVQGQIIVKYQCIGNLDAAPASQPSPYSYAPPSAPTSALVNPAGELSKEQWQQQQLKRLQEDSSLSYEEYSKRYRMILAQ